MKYKAIIVDDESWTREVLKQLGKWDEYNIEIAGEAADGDYGLEMARAIHPDIILTDVNMPNLDGISFIRTIREERNNAQIIFISGYDNYDYIRNALKLEALDYILKPIKPDEFNGVLKQCSDLLNKNLEEKKEHQSPLKGDFLNTLWLEDFHRICEKLQSALITNQQNKIQDNFKELIAISANNLNLSKANIIYIYFILLEILQRDISSYSFELKEIFGDINTSFVFDIDTTIIQVLDFVSNLYFIASAKIDELIKSSRRFDINKVQSYLIEHYREVISLEQVAGIFHVSKEYLSHLFKQEMGVGFSEYLTSLKMNKARELILIDKMPIKEAAFSVGYIDLAHFYKTFKKTFGKPPGDMLKYDSKDFIRANKNC